MALTQSDQRRLAQQCDGSVTIDPNLKHDIQKSLLKEFVAQIETKLARTKKKVVVFLAEIK
jgi:hypothetical protein